MSLAMYAAPFENESNQDNKENNNIVDRKRASASNSKTQKRYPPNINGQQNQNMPGTGGDPGNSQKVMSILQTIQNLPPSSDDMADFNPLPPPSSVGVQSTIDKEKSKQTSAPQQSGFQSGIPSSLQSNMYSNLEDSSYIPSSSSQDDRDDYYKRFIPNYDEMYKNSGLPLPNAPQTHTVPYKHPKMNYSSGNNDPLIEKLNYMIHLLEEQQDERTNNVTEEIVLYSFLGIFIIFIVDSFARVGKYTR